MGLRVACGRAGVLSAEGWSRVVRPSGPADRHLGVPTSRFALDSRPVGVPARARCGFGATFRPGWLEDHWVAECWNAAAGRWQMVDAQLDDTWRRAIGFDGDALAITPDDFVTAGHAWQAWRRGDLDAGRCGLSAIGEHGPHWIAGNLRLDLASLNKVEMLPWDRGWRAQNPVPAVGAHPACLEGAETPAATRAQMPRPVRGLEHTCVAAGRWT